MDHVAARLKDGRVLVTGGLDYFGRLATSEIFDPAKSAWIGTGALKTARSQATADALQDGRILVVSGSGSDGALADSEIFDPNATGTLPAPRSVVGPGAWSIKPSQPAQSYEQDARLLKDGRVLVLPGGGYPNFVAQIYDAKSGSWMTSITRTSDQQSIFGVALADDRVLLLTLDSDGVRPGKAEVIDVITGAAHSVTSPGNLRGARLDLLPDGRVWLTAGPYGDKRTLFYDPAADRWSSGPDMPMDSYIVSVTAIPGGKVLVGGLLKAMILDPKTGAWTDAGAFPLRWSNYSTTSLPGRDVLFSGGWEDQTQPDGRVLQVTNSRVLRWNHLTGKLDLARPLPAPRAGHSTVVLNDGHVLVAGGVSGDTQSDPVATALIYDPVKDRWSPAQSMPQARSQMTAVLLTDGTVLEVGGYGFFNPTGTLVYAPSVAKVSAAAASTAEQPVAAIVGLLTLVAAGLILWLLTSARRRRRG